MVGVGIVGESARLHCARAVPDDRPACTIADALSCWAVDVGDRSRRPNSEGMMASVLKKSKQTNTQA